MPPMRGGSKLKMDHDGSFYEFDKELWQMKILQILILSLFLSACNGAGENLLGGIIIGAVITDAVHHPRRDKVRRHPRYQGNYYPYPRLKPMCWTEWDRYYLRYVRVCRRY